MISEPPTVFKARIATLLAFVLVGILALVTLSQKIATAHQGSLETSIQDSAVGNSRFSPVPASIDTPVFTFGGKPFIAKDLEPRKIRSSEMQRIGTSDSGQFALYTHKNGFFVKTGKDRFLQVQQKD